MKSTNLYSISKFKPTSWFSTIKSLKFCVNDIPSRLNSPKLSQIDFLISLLVSCELFNLSKSKLDFILVFLTFISLFSEKL